MYKIILWENANDGENNHFSTCSIRYRSGQTEPQTEQIWLLCDISVSSLV